MIIAINLLITLSILLPKLLLLKIPIIHHYYYS